MNRETIQAANEIAKKFNTEIRECEDMAPGTDAIPANDAKKLVSALNAAGIPASVQSGGLLCCYVNLD